MATLVEIIAYYIPIVDYLLDAVAIPLATIASTLILVATVIDLILLITWALALIAGGGIAAVVKSSASATRFGSTVSRAGLSNLLVSTVETGTSIIMFIVSVFYQWW
jgi:hypothetical protein